MGVINPHIFSARFVNFIGGQDDLAALICTLEQSETLTSLLGQMRARSITVDPGPDLIRSVWR